MTRDRSLHRAPPILRWGITTIVAFFAVLHWVQVVANARDFGEWNSQNSAIRKWFERLKTPNSPLASCCGEADGYWADDFEVKDNHYVAIITDTRPDGPLYRIHIEPGTRIIIPNNRIVRDPENPTGHGWVFTLDNIVFCYLPPGGG